MPSTTRFTTVEIIYNNVLQQRLFPLLSLSKAEERKYVSNVLKANGFTKTIQSFAFRTLETYFLSSAFEKINIEHVMAACAI